MTGISGSELVTIALIVLIVFGPRRLPDISRRMGRLIRAVRGYAADLRATIEAEADSSDTTPSLGDARREMGPTDRQPGPQG